MSQPSQQIFARHFRGRQLALSLLAIGLMPLASGAQEIYLAQNYPTPPPPNYSQQNYIAPLPVQGGDATSGDFLAPPQLNDLVSRIALYPDDLIGIILPASTFPLQIVEASRYLDEVRSNSTLSPNQSWDNSVVALLNYPDVINMMNHDLQWTQALGQAVINQQTDVITAIGQFRSQAQAAGNLRSDERQVVEVQEGAIRIRPANPQIIYVPQYEPSRVIVYQSEPVFSYYPRPYPVYYYNYSSGYPSGFANFWGVSTLFSIGWSTGRVHLHDYDYYDDSRFDHPHNGHFYRRGRHDWDRNNGPTWGDHGHHDDDGHHGKHDDDGHQGRDAPPRERDWHPPPRKGQRGGAMAVDNGGKGRGNPAPRSSNNLGTQARQPTPVPTTRDSSPRQPTSASTTRDPTPRQPISAQTPAPTPTTRDSSTRGSNATSSGGGTSGRRNTTVTAPQQQTIPSFNQRSPVKATPRSVETPVISAPAATRRSTSPNLERNPFVREPAQQRTISRPAPRSAERQSMPAPRSTFSQPAPTRNMRNTDTGSSPRAAPSQPAPRAAPVAPPRGGDTPTSTRRNTNADDRGQNSRDR